MMEVVLEMMMLMIWVMNMKEQQILMICVKILEMLTKMRILMKI